MRRRGTAGPKRLQQSTSHLSHLLPLLVLFTLWIGPTILLPIGFAAAASPPGSRQEPAHQLLDLRHLDGTNNPTNKTKGGQRALSCRASFEPTCDMYPYVRYWNKRFTERDCYRSPLLHPLRSFAPIEERKYVVFEPDCAQWNNIRMAAEVVVMFAIASGRTLVLPPMIMHHLHARSGQQQPSEDRDSVFGGASSFFDFSKISELIDVITMEEFLATVAAKGLLNKTLPDVPLHELTGGRINELWDYLKDACYQREWNPEGMFIIFKLSSPGRDMGSAAASTPGSRGTETETETETDAITGARLGPLIQDERFVDFGTLKNQEAMRQAMPYNAAFHAHRAVYFTGHEYRVLGQWYGFLYFPDPARDRQYKRVARDRLRPSDGLFCAAGRVVRLIHGEAAAAAAGGQLLQQQGAGVSRLQAHRRTLSQAGAAPQLGREDAEPRSLPAAWGQDTLEGAEFDPLPAAGTPPGLGQRLYRMMPRAPAGGTGRTLKARAWELPLEPGREVVQGQQRANPHTLGGDVHFGATYHALHIRRGDFESQFKSSIQASEQLFNNVSPLLNRSVTRLLYIATDESDRSYFSRFERLFEVRYLSDYVGPASLQRHLSKHVHMGAIEQIVCANAHTFVGTPLSTFSAYITRLRGYYRDGRYGSTYYALPQDMYQIQKRGTELYAPLWARDWPNAHLNIDDQD